LTNKKEKKLIVIPPEKEYGQSNKGHSCKLETIPLFQQNVSNVKTFISF
jgi:hypothetical protein